MAVDDQSGQAADGLAENKAGQKPSDVAQAMDCERHA